MMFTKPSIRFLTLVMLVVMLTVPELDFKMSATFDNESANFETSPPVSFSDVVVFTVVAAVIVFNTLTMVLAFTFVPFSAFSYNYSTPKFTWYL